MVTALKVILIGLEIISGFLLVGVVLLQKSKEQGIGMAFGGGMGENLFGAQTGIDTTRLYPTSRLVSSITGMHPPRNKAIVGENAFAHEAGIHQHGMLQHASTYEIMRPEDVGIAKSNLVLGKHSGRHAFRDRVRELGFDLDEFETNRAFQEFKKLADKKKDVYDGDIEAIIMNVDNASAGPWTLKSLQEEYRRDFQRMITRSLPDERR